jgi:predicted N-acyltransferase
MLHFETCYYQAIDYAIANAACRMSKPARRAATSWREDTSPY